MKIIIPMAGAGYRFIEKGYKEPKFLIDIDGKPIIEHIINLFSNEKDFIFICNEKDVKETNIVKILNKICPTGRVITIPTHKKGPVYSVSKIYNLLNDEEEIIVNYCDFSCYWDYNNFLKNVRKKNVGGTIVAYKGFHPHMLGSDNYAFIKNDKNNKLIKIQEKKPFTDNKMNEYASSGTYYFKKGKILKKYFDELMGENINTNGEYYVSEVYNLLIKDNLNTSIYEIEYMLQWGTPYDLEIYKSWSSYFKNIIKKQNNLILEDTTILIPLAGKGERFTKDGYKIPKPLIKINDKPMVIQSVNCLPKSKNYVFVCQNDHLKKYKLKDDLIKNYKNSKIIGINKITDGQACTCEIGINEGNVDLEKPLLISASDNGVYWNREKYIKLLNDESVDIIIWSFKNNQTSRDNPNMYSYLKIDENNNVLNVSVKSPISNDSFNDQTIIGTMFFRKARYFIEGLKKLYDKNITTNGEFYVDNVINEVLDKKIKIFEVDNYICWGTPNDLKTYKYWQSFFDKCEWHDYKIENDITFK